MELGMISDYALYNAHIQLEKEKENFDLAEKLSRLAREPKEETTAEKPAEEESEEPDYETEEAWRAFAANVQLGNYSDF